jgi:hypothetical protein
MAETIDAQSVPPAEADYILVGRYVGNRLSYAWLRSLVRRRDQRKIPLPLQTKWTKSDIELHRALARLKKIYGWQTLQSPPQARFPYHLEIRRVRDQRLVGERESVMSDSTYRLLLRAAQSPPEAVRRRYVYAFAVDSDGRSTLLFPAPEAGSVENRLPDAGTPAEIALNGSGFQAAAPFGVDTYFLLTSEEPLANPAILEWDSVRGEPPETKSELEKLLLLTAMGTRGQPIATPATWSIERLTRESVRSRRHKGEP